MEKIKVLLADDHILVREGIKLLLTHIPEVEIVGEASNGEQVLKLLESTSVDMVLMDIEMPILNGIKTTKRIVEQYKEIKIVILSTYHQNSFSENMEQIGAHGYLMKNTSLEALSTAIKEIASGGVYFYDTPIPIDMDNESFLSAELTEKEMAIIKQITKGYQNKQIADILHLSTRTIDTYRANIMRKLKVQNTAELVALCIKIGLV